MRVLHNAAQLAVLLVSLISSIQAQTPYSGHGAGSIPREKIAQYAPPPLDPDVTRRIQMMLDVRSPGLGRVTPDGKRLVFGWSITGTPAVWRLDGPKSFPVQMTGGEDPTGVAGITPDGRWLVLSRDRGGQEDPGLYLQPIDGGSFRLIQHTPKSRASYSFTTKDSRTIYYTSNDIKPDSYAIYKYDIAAGKRDLVFSDPGLWFIADHREADGGEMQLLLHKATGALSAEYYEWSSATRALKPLFGQAETTEYRAQYAAQPGQLLVLTNKLGEFRRLYGWDATAGLRPITPEMNMDVSGCGTDRAKKRIYCTVNDGGYSRLRVMDARTLQPLEIPVSKDADHVYTGPASDDGRFVTIGVETAKAPRTNYVFDWDTQTLTQWVLPSAPEVDLSQFAIARLESYPARDGTKIPMFVRYPARCAPGASPPSEPCPVIVEFHGGPEGQAGPGFSPYAQLFVDAGFIFVEPNVRGSDGYGKTWLKADDGPKRLDIITDIEDAGKALRTRWTRDGRVPKIGIFGGSYGGYSTLIGMTMFAGTYDAGVSIVGTSNLLTFLQNTAPYRRALRASEYGDPQKDAEALRKLSPTTYVDRLKSPLLMIQGVDDPRVPAGESLQMHEALKAQGKPSSLILLEGEGHGAARRSGQVTMIGHALRFFEEHLRGKKAPTTN
jgi:dipeptidyl aminopeptidase/acylaminoacyl peptidase